MTHHGHWIQCGAQWHDLTCLWNWSPTKTIKILSRNPLHRHFQFWIPQGPQHFSGRGPHHSGILHQGEDVPAMCSARHRAGFVGSTGPTGATGGWGEAGEGEVLGPVEHRDLRWFKCSRWHLIMQTKLYNTWIYYVDTDWFVLLMKWQFLLIN